MQQYAKGEGEGEQMLVARATMGLFWASDFANDGNLLPGTVGHSLPPFLEAINLYQNLGKEVT